MKLKVHFKGSILMPSILKNTITREEYCAAQLTHAFLSTKERNCYLVTPKLATKTTRQKELT